MFAHKSHGIYMPNVAGVQFASSCTYKSILSFAPVIGHIKKKRLFWKSWYIYVFHINWFRWIDVGSHNSIACSKMLQTCYKFCYDEKREVKLNGIKWWRRNNHKL